MTTSSSGRPDQPSRELLEDVELSGQGRLRGTREGDLIVFRGVRYAQDPFGANRFGRPKPVTPWDGTRHACAFAPASPQAPRVPGSDVYGGTDCLALNIWTPCASSGRLPVLVWIPGGAYMRGDACDSIYDGAVFARQGIVFVSLNYRVGIDGFMFLPDAPANRGLLDQIAALEWIQDHIKSFGGDPAQVTVGGGSAGAGAITCLLGLSRAKALFSRAILQSPSVATQTAAEATSSADAICSLLNVARTAASMATVPIADCVSALSRLADDAALGRSLGMTSRNFFPLRAVVDGELLAEEPLTALQRHWMRRSMNVSILVGSNRDEMRLYLVPNGSIDRVTDDDLQRFVADAGLLLGAEASYHFALSTRGDSSPSSGEVLCSMQSDYFYRIPARRIAEQAADAGLDAYLYEFEWESSRYERRLLAAHGVEIPFVFQKLLTKPGQEITGPAAPAALATEMNEAWVSFVQSGDPGWPKFDKSNRWIRRFGNGDAVTKDVVRPEIEVWESIL
jgi:para-nitrobenzyl esterase